MPSVSIIVPVYNSEKYIEECLNSISGQTYKDFEAIIIDDGSTDSSPILVDSFASLDSRFKVLHKKNEGVSVARNVGLVMAQGEYITMVDSDDTLAENYIEVLYRACSELNVDVAVCNKIYLVKDGLYEDCLSEEIADGHIISGSDVLNTFYNPYRVAYYAWGKMFLRSTIGELRYPIDVWLCEDDLFNVSFYSIPKINAVFCSNTRYEYRIHGESATQSVTPEKVISKIRAYCRILEISEKYRGSPFQMGARRDFVLSWVGLLICVFRTQDKFKYDKKRIAKKILRVDSDFGKILPLKYRLICEICLISPQLARMVYIIGSQLKHLAN